MEDKPKEQTLKELEEELAAKKAKIESPFAAIGIAVAKPRGRPPKGTQVHNAPVTPEGEQAAIANDQRMAEINKPASDLSSEGMRDWAEKEVHGMLGEAVARYKWAIKYSDEKTALDVADKIFKATGIAQKDVSQFGKGGSIVINLGGAAGANSIDLPWVKRANNSEPSVPIVTTLEAETKGKK